MNRQRVIVGMSGGVDSAVTAYLLMKSGYDVIGMTLKTWVGDNGAESRCCEISDAQAVCGQLGIPYYVQNCLDTFREQITAPFVQEYLCGRTPNPCVICNCAVKWYKLLEAADMMHAAYIATGHYASVVQMPVGRYTVQKGAYSQKDQSYMLWYIDPAWQARTGEISERIGRGRQTTRHVELFRLPSGAYIADTPGFSSFDISRMDLVLREDLAHAFRDFAPYLGACRYRGCTHRTEQDCAVRQALADGEIEQSRYESYLALFDSMKDLHEWELPKTT